MHHITHYDIHESPDGFDIIYTVERSGKKITLNIPRDGVLEEPERECSRQQVDIVAREIGKTLSHGLASAQSFMGATRI